MAIHCSDIETLVHTYLDGELAEGDTCEFEAHTHECESCRQRLQEEIEFRTDLRRKLAPPHTPAGLRDRICEALDAEDNEIARASRRRRSSWILPGVATVAAAAALLLFFQVQTRQPPAAEPVTHDAVKAHLRKPPIEVQGASQVSPWIKRHFEPSVEPPRFSSSDVNLRGARLSHLRGRDAAQLFYEARRGPSRHEVQVHIIDGSNLDLRGAVMRRIGGRELFVDRKLGYSIVTYKDQQDGMAYVFTSDMSEQDLLDLVVSSDLLLKASEHRNR